MDNDIEITRKIIGAAYTVLNTLRPGLDEKLYERALQLEMSEVGLRVEAQRQFKVHYRDQLIGTLIPDLIVEGRVVVETKVVADFHDSHVAQVLGYLALADLRTGLLLNFSSSKLGIQRVLR